MLGTSKVVHCLSFLMLCQISYAAEDALPNGAIIDQWQCEHSGEVRFLPDGKHIAISTMMPREMITVYTLDGQLQHSYDFGLQSAGVAIVRKTKQFDNGCIAIGSGYNEEGMLNWIVELFDPENQKIAEWNYGPRYSDNNWIEYTTCSPDARFLASYWAGPFSPRTVIKDTVTGSSKELGNVSLPGFSSDNSQCVVSANGLITIYSCEDLFSNDVTE